DARLLLGGDFLKGVRAGAPAAHLLEDGPHDRGIAAAQERPLMRELPLLVRLVEPPRELVHPGALGRRVAKGARLLLGELLDLTADLRAQRTAAPLDRLELLVVARELSLEPARARRELPHLLGRLL